MKLQTDNIVESNVEKIGALFPNCITESKDDEGKIKKAINFEILKQMLSEDVVEGNEKYEFTWVGKRDSIKEANKPIRKTLRPCKEESVNWDTTENLYIEGDNLEALKLLQESYLGKIKMIYIDPPYNTGEDFIYNDDFKMDKVNYEDEMNIKDEDGNRLFKNTENNGRFHSDWCSMMYSRLIIARNLMSNDGLIFISINDREQENLKKISDEVFGANNFISTFIRKTAFGEKTAKPKINRHHEYFHVYSKNIVTIAENEGIRGKKNEFSDYSNPDNDPKGPWKKDSLLIKIDNGRKGFARYGIYNPYLKTTDYPPVYFDESNRKQWHYVESTFNSLLKNNQVVFYKTLEEKGKNEYGFYIKKYRPKNEKYNNLSTLFALSDKYAKFMLSNDYTNSKGTSDLEEVIGKNNFSYPKPQKFIMEIIKSLEGDDFIVLDFFSGTSTTAQAVMQLNSEDNGIRKFILIQIPEKVNNEEKIYKDKYKNICEVGKERIRRAGKKILEENPLLAGTLDVGFRVFKVDESNMKDVYYNPNEISQSNLFDMLSNIKEDRTDLDLLFGCLLEWGLPLSMPYSSFEIDNIKIHDYNNGDLIACFDENITEEVIKEIAKKEPLRVVFRDSSFKDDASKTNVVEIFKMLSADTKIKVI